MNDDRKGDKVPVGSVPCHERIDRLAVGFQEEYGYKPSFFVRVPGRINIIGEHIDYCGYPVLPMALEQDIIVATGFINKLEVHVRNLNKSYENFQMGIKTIMDTNIQPELNEKPFWYNYVVCGIKGAIEYLDGKIMSGLQLLVDGNIPPASGLSSSSALVSAACLAFLYAHNVTISKSKIATLCAKSEQYIGTQGGGMDQAIAFLAEENCAQYITWQPLSATSICLPSNASFVVAHSLAEANKAATNDFNRRVIECRLAAKLLEMSCKASGDSTPMTLSQLQKHLNCSLEEMVKLVKKYLVKDVYTKDEICNLLKLDKEQVDNLYLTSNTTQVMEFKLKQRALHVYQEAQRVEDFRKICTEFTMNGNINNNVVEKLGKLISASHESLKNLYNCSHKNLDMLVDISSKMDVAARVTGAGWGGCIVALCPNEKVQPYIDMLKSEYYAKHFNISDQEANTHVFGTKAYHGAMIYDNNNSK